MKVSLASISGLLIRFDISRQLARMPAFKIWLDDPEVKTTVIGLLLSFGIAIGVYS